MINKINCSILPKVSFGNKKSPEPVNKEVSKSEDPKRLTDAEKMRNLLDRMEAIRNKLDHRLPVTQEEMEFYKGMVDSIEAALNPEMVGNNFPRPINPKK